MAKLDEIILSPPLPSAYSGATGGDPLMSVAVVSRPIVLCADPTSEPEVRAALQPAGFDVALKSIHDATPMNGAPVQLILIDGGVHSDSALKLCRQLRSQLG